MVDKSNFYKSEEKIIIKKELQNLKELNEAPKWMKWFSYVNLKFGNYLLIDETPKGMYRRIAKTAASYLPEDNKQWEEKFFNLLWKNWLCGSTPVLGNLGTNRGLAVSCSATLVEDSLESILSGYKEIGMLSKHGCGTALHFNIRDGRTNISTGGTTNALTDWIKLGWETQNKVTQSNLRRGSSAFYINFRHNNVIEVLDMLETHDRLHVGIIIDDEDIEALENNDSRALHVWREILKWRMIKGKPYIINISNAQRQDPVMYKKHKLSTKHSNLCTEIFLNTDADHTLSCVLSSMNCRTFDEWKDTDAVFISTVFLDCIAEDLIKRGRELDGIEKFVKSTIKGRALGLGLLGFHTYIQEKNETLDGIFARGINHQIFKHMADESLRASQYMAKWLGEPEWCKGYGVRNTHRLAVAPNTSSALNAGGYSQGIEPIAANVFTQPFSKTTLLRINSTLLKLLREKGKYTEEIIDSIALTQGSVQHLDFLTDHEKLVFRTAFELNQKTLIDLAEQRQQFICQGQSLNLFFSAEEEETVIHNVHKHALKQPLLKSLYYIRTLSGVKADTNDECVVCEG